MGFVEQVVDIEVNRYKDSWRFEALQEGKLEQAKVSVRNLIQNSNFSDRDIAKLIDVPLVFVKSMRTQTGLIAP